MPSPAAARPRLNPTAIVAVVASAAVAGALAAGPLLAQPVDDPLRPLTELLAVAGLVLAAIGLALGAPSWAMTAAGCFAAELVSTLFEHAPRIEAWTPITAAGLLLLCELVAWSAEARDGAIVMPRGEGPKQLPRPAVIVLATGTAWLATTALAVLASAVPGGRDLVIAAVGAASVAVLASALLASVQRRS